MAALVAAYLAGRMPLVEQPQKAKSQANDARARLAKVEKNADTTCSFWSSLVLSQRPDIQNARYATLIHFLPDNVGCSLPYPVDESSLTSFTHRWHINWSADKNLYLAQMEAIDATFVVLYSDPPETVLVRSVNSELTTESFGRIGANLLKPTDEVFSIIEQAVAANRTPDIVFQALPELPTVFELRNLELEFANENAIEIDEVEKTTFEFITDGNTLKLSVSGMETEDAG